MPRSSMVMIPHMAVCKMARWRASLSRSTISLGVLGRVLERDFHWSACHPAVLFERGRKAARTFVRSSMAMRLLAWLIFVVAALLEVSGDAIIRIGLQGRRPIYIVVGCMVLGCYGLVVNVV